MQLIHPTVALLLLTAPLAAQHQLARITPLAPGPEDHSGTAVATSGIFGLAGSPFDDDRGVDSGSAYLFNTSTHTRIARLFASDAAAGDGFGTAIAISGDLAVIGAPDATGNVANAGAAYVFRLSDRSEIAKLAASDGTSGANFGRAVDIFGDRVIVGSAGITAEAAYVYDLRTGAETKLAAPTDQPRQNFGIGVAISSDLIVVGASASSKFGHHAGLVYIYDAQTGAIVSELHPKSPTGNYLFGELVDVDGTNVAVGAPWNSTHTPFGGAAYVFDGLTGHEIASLVSSPFRLGGHFGASIAIEKHTVVVTAPTEGVGEAFVFDVRSGAQLDRLVPQAGRPLDQFGTSVSIDGEVIAIGAPNHAGGSRQSGATFLYSTSARSNVRNGSGGNAVILDEVHGATVGGVWQAELDCSGHRPSLAAVVLHSAPTSGVFVRGGEVLIDLTSPRLGVLFVPHAGGSVTFALPIPDPLLLYGATAVVQGVVFGAPGYELSNAIDFTVGR